MNTTCGGNEFSIIYAWRRRTIMVMEDRYFRSDGKARGILVRRKCWHGAVWYHRLTDYLKWDIHLRTTDISQHKRDEGAE